MPARKLLVLDPSKAGDGICQRIQSSGWEVRTEWSLPVAQAVANQGQYLVGLLVLPAEANLVVQDLERLTAEYPMEWMILLSATWLREPAWGKLIVTTFCDYHTLPIDLNRLLITLGHALGRADLKHKLIPQQECVGRYQMIGRSAPMLDLYAKLDRMTRVDAPVLITGESGTGKELVARAIHQHSSRSRGPFVPVNCGGLPESLVQSELFGHEKGAFTGAHQRKVGSIEAARGGVIFLDEIGDLPIELQANLLRFLQERIIVRVGSTQRIPIDVRVIAATHLDLNKAGKEGRFREDLFYRLNVLHLDLAPLRERDGDIELFAQALFKEFKGEKSATVQGFSADAMRAMREYAWPGNVRELMNRVQHAMIMSENRLITPPDLGFAARATASNVITLSHVRAAAERDLISLTLRDNANNVSKAARVLGVSRVTLYRLMEKFKIANGRDR